MKDKEETNEELISRFFREELSPIAEAAKERGIEIFPLGPDPNCESYFIERKSGENYLHKIDRNHLESELSRLWAQDDVVGIGDLAGAIVELANVLRETEQDPEDISPFIYAMF